MKIKSFFWVLIIFLIALSVSDNGLSQQLEVMDAFPEVFTQRPVGAEFSHSGSPYIYVYTRDGAIKRFNKDNPELPPVDWFDLPSDVQFLSEGGLLGLAFHPDFPENS